MGEEEKKAQIATLEKTLADSASFKKNIATPVFNSLDQNKTGELGEDEIGAFLIGMCGDMGIETPTKGVIQETFKFLDKDANGKIDLDEFGDFLMFILQKQLDGLKGAA